jgi:uridine kinase
MTRGGVNDAHRSLLDRLADAVVGAYPDRRLRIAIDGVDGAGKTTLADALAPLVVAKGRPVIRASVDDFHNPRSVRYARGRHSPDGFYLDSYDYDSFHRLLLEPLSPNGSGEYAAKRFDLDNDKPFDLEPQHAAPTAALIIDGIFLHRARLRSCWDLSVFLKVGFDVSLPRGAARGPSFDATDPESAPHRRYVGGQRRYLAECDPEQRADIVIDYSDLQAPVVLKWTS